MPKGKRKPRRSWTKEPGAMVEYNLPSDNQSKPEDSNAEAISSLPPEMIQASSSQALKSLAWSIRRELQRRSEDVDDHGCLVWGNVWIKVGLPREVAKRLRLAADANLKRGHRRVGTMAWHLLLAALDHQELMVNHLHRMMGDGGLPGIERAAVDSARTHLNRLN